MSLAARSIAFLGDGRWEMGSKCELSFCWSRKSITTSKLASFLYKALVMLMERKDAR